MNRLFFDLIDTWGIFFIINLSNTDRMSTASRALSTNYFTVEAKSATVCPVTNQYLKKGSLLIPQYAVST
jgi:hypothetical protein